MKLNELPTLTTNGQSTNALFFADDGALHATSLPVMQTLLNVCHTWSQENGITFAPKKCAILANSNMTYTYTMNASQ
jgi:hypothetical protein